MTEKRTIKLLVVISLVVLGVVYFVPMFSMEGIVRSDDTTFHLGRLAGMSNVWQSPVNFNSFGNNGTMVNIFYPWLTMYPMWILYKLTGSYVIAYKLYYTILTVATLLIAYLSLHSITKSRIGAYIFAVLYAFSSYRYADIFNRGALGEAIALTFLPLVLMGIYKICMEDHSGWRWLTAGMTLTAYSHILSLCMAAALVGVVYIVTLAFQDNRGQRFISLVKAAGLSVGLCLAMIVPMLEQYGRNELFTPEGNGDTLSGSAYSLSEIIKFTIDNNPEGRGIGILTLLSLIAACILLILRRIKLSAEGKQMQNDERFAVLLMLLGVITVVCTTGYLPWQSIGNTPVSTIQFVWRLNAYAMLLITGAFSILVAKTAEHSRVGAVFILAVVIAASVGIHGCNLYTDKGIYTDKAFIMEEDIAKWPSGNVDYAPYKAKDYRDENGKTMEYMYINGIGVGESPETDKKGTYYRQKLEYSDDSRVVDIPVFRYYGQQLMLDGEPAGSVESERGTSMVSIPASTAPVIEISYKYTPVARAAWAFSILVLVISTAYQCRKNHA